MHKLFEDVNIEVIDTLNDRLTEMTDEVVQDSTALAVLIGEVDKVLGASGMRLDFEDIESLFEDWEEPSEYDAINVVFPLVGKDNEQTEYNLSLTYAMAEDTTGYMVDLEVQYSWESDDEIETAYVELGED